MGIKKVTSLHGLGLRLLYEQVVDFILPPYSLITGQPIRYGPQKNAIEEDALKPWQNISFLDAPCCDLCGFPFEFDQGEAVLCGQCLVRPPRYDRGRSAIVYNEFSKKLVLDFKHGGRTDGVDFFARQMVRAGRRFLHEMDFLVPVPLHRARLRKRRFNQSALLARQISLLSGLPYECSLLQRVKNTPSQGIQSFAQRKKNVRAAFRICPQNVEKIKGANIVLIDDVLTSGATLEACALTLKKAGASQVNILTLMRVVRTHTPKNTDQ
ncbi:MAG: ComF family protein [Robiginitomaculum sp.]|nr:ComF family protein [Robiginitomaculum sp.]